MSTGAGVYLGAGLDPAAEPAPAGPPLAPVTGPTSTSALEELRAELAVKVARDPITVPVPLRPAYAVRCDPNVREAVLEQWRKASRDGSRTGGVDVVRFSCLVLANTNGAVLRNGAPLLAAAGGPLLLRSEDLMDLTGTQTTPAAVLALFGGDGADPDVMVAADRVLAAAGYSAGAASGLDPTQG